VPELSVTVTFLNQLWPGRLPAWIHGVAEYVTQARRECMGLFLRQPFGWSEAS